MAPLISAQIPTAMDRDVIQNRVAVAVATRERLIKSWTALSSRQCPPLRTQEELDAEDAELFYLAPPHLGLGAPIPKAYLQGNLVGKDISSNEKLRHLFLANNSGRHKGSKSRDSQEKACGIKRFHGDDSSDEDEGRSGLGKAKKFKPIDSSGQTAKDPMRIDNIQRSESGPAVNNCTEKRLSQTAPSSKNATREGIVAKKPLVDYPSDDDCGGGLPAAVTVAPAIPERKLSPTPQPKAPSVLNPPGPKDMESENVTDQTRAVTRKTISKNFSSNTSSKESSRVSSSDSEPSDLETVIPVSLDADMKEIDSAAADEARRARKRQKKRTKKMERQSRQKASKLASGSGGKPITSVVGPVIAKKLKDKLLDANGN